MELTNKIELVQASAPEDTEAVDTRARSAVAPSPAVAANSGSLSDTESRSGPLRSSTVMMVDDDPIMLEVVQTYLEEAGYTSFVTTSEPGQAIELFRQRRPD